MKKQPDLILLAPEKFNYNFSLFHSRKHIINKNLYRSIAGNIIPLSTEYGNINLRETTPIKRISKKNIFSNKKSPLPIISKQGLFYDTNRLLTINNKKSYGGFKPIEDHKIRNKIKIKDINSPLSIQ